MLVNIMEAPCIQVTQRYLEYLVSQRRFEDAAQVCSRLLKVVSPSPFTLKSLVTARF